jgi:hypothetical protein
MDVWCLCVCVCVFVCVFLCLCTDRDLAKSWSPGRGVLPNVEDLVNRSETESFMEVGQGPNWGCSTKGKKYLLCVVDSNSIYLSTSLCWTLAAFLVSWSSTKSVGLLDGDQPIARPLPAHRTPQTQTKRPQTSMPLVGLEPTISVFEQAATVIGNVDYMQSNYCIIMNNKWEILWKDATAAYFKAPLRHLAGENEANYNKLQVSLYHGRNSNWFCSEYKLHRLCQLVQYWHIMPGFRMHGALPSLPT